MRVVEKELAALREVENLLSDKSRWCKGTYAKGKNGANVDCDSPQAVQWCAVGAMARISNKTEYKGPIGMYSRLLARVSKALGTRGVSSTNDGPGGYEAIITAVQIAIADAEKEAVPS